MKQQIEREAGNTQNYGKNVIVSLESGKDLKGTFLGYKDKNMRLVYETGIIDIPLNEIRVTHLDKSQQTVGNLFGCL